MQGLRTTCALALLAGLVPGFAAAVTLSNGMEDGDVTAELTLTGASRYMYYDPIGEITGRDLAYFSDTYLWNGGSLTSLSSYEFAATLVSRTGNQVVSSFSIGALAFTLTQTLQDTFSNAVRTGSILTQTLQMTNVGVDPLDFALVRYLDGDLYFNDGTLADGGGVLQVAGQTVLFETDASGSASDADTFVGITAEGGSFGGYAVQDCCGVNVMPLPNTVHNDTNGDGFVDTAFDVTLQLQRDFSLAAGAGQVFSTTTLFGSGVPPAPGSAESLPLIDSDPELNEDGVPVYSFEIPDSYQPGQVIWIDPVVAVGYTYEVTGSSFASVQAPSFAAVADPDGYVLTVGGVDIALASGATYVFAPGVTSFTLSGIDPALGLDPNNPQAFVTGISLGAFSQTSAIVTMTPVTANVSAVPLPATGWALIAGIGGLAALRRRRRAA